MINQTNPFPPSLISSEEYVAKILDYLDNPDSVARVSTVWKRAASIAWIKKFEPFHLTESMIQYFEIQKGLLYALCSKCNFSFRRCIDEQGIDVARKMALQIYHLDQPPQPIKSRPIDLSLLISIIEAESIRKFLLKNLYIIKGKTCLANSSINSFDYKEKKDLIDTFLKELSLIKEEKKETYITSWLSTHTNSLLCKEISLANPRQDSPEKDKIDEDLFMPPISIISCMHPKMLKIKNNPAIGISERLSGISSITYIIFDLCDTVHFPELGKMKNLEVVEFIDCYNMQEIPKSLVSCPNLQKIILIACENLLHPLSKEIKDELEQKSYVQSEADIEALRVFTETHKERLFKHSEVITQLTKKGVKIFFSPLYPTIF